MKNLNIIISTTIVSLIMISCGGETAAIDEAKAYSESPIAADTSLSSSAAIEDMHSSRRFVRTADLKFKVKDVRSATYAIEDVIAHNNGFVTHTNLSSAVSYVNVIPVSIDSAMEITRYNVENSIEIRVPNTRLDDALKQMSGLVEFLDYRNINADDVTLKLLSNKLIQKRISTHEDRMDKAIHVGGKLKETTAAENSLLEKEAQKDQALIANLSIQDQVDFSTIKIYLYQRSSLKEEMIAQEKMIEPYEASFFSKVGESLAVGLEGLEILVLSLLKIWWIILLGVVGFIGYRRFKK